MANELISLDFDGTLSTMTPSSAVQYLGYLIGHHFKPVIHSRRAINPGGIESIHTHLDLSNTLGFIPITAVKPDAALFIDNRAYRYTDHMPHADAIRALIRDNG